MRRIFREPMYMLALLQQPYVFAAALAFLTAIFMYLYTKTTDREPAAANKAFFKTLTAGLLTGLALTYFTAPGAPIADVPLVEPFDAVPVATAALPSGI